MQLVVLRLLALQLWIQNSLKTTPAHSEVSCIFLVSIIRTICEYENTEVVVAMKSLHTLSADSHVKIFREAMVLCAFSHSNIVQFFGVYVDSPKCSADVGKVCIIVNVFVFNNLPGF